MRWHILYSFRTGPYGGGNQFLRALRGQMRQQGCYSETASEADIILANANPGSLLMLLTELLRLKRRWPHSIVIVRVDGPISLIRGDNNRRIDDLTCQLITMFADGVIFQSEWSRQQNKQLYSINAPYESVILNTPNPAIFYPAPVQPQHGAAANFKIIATSWSHHWRKGFATYQYLDNNLDFNRYEMTFVGNSPVAFKNIHVHPPVDSPRLGELLRHHDIYITASTNDPCSNSVAEALACGLPVVARNSGGHAELIDGGGLLFSNTSEVIQAIDTVAQSWNHYRRHIPRRSLAATVQAYNELAQTIHTDIRWKKYQPKQASVWVASQSFVRRLQYRLTPL